MGRIEKSIQIKSSPEKVWEMLAFDRFPEWMDMMKHVEYTSEVHTSKDKYRVGAITHGIPKGYEEFNCNFELTESLKNEKMTHRLWEKVYHGTLGGLITYTLELVEAGTRFTCEVNFNEIPWGILGKIISPLWQRMGRKEYEKALENLKSILEK